MKYRGLALLVAVAVVVAAFVSQLFTPSTIVLGTLIVNGQPREYRMVNPRAIQGEKNVPVVIALHGALDTMEDMAAHTGLDELAVEKGFLLVYLQGRLLNWPPSISAENPDVMEPDFEFFTAMCDDLVREHHADSRRIYLVGVSQGGAMANAVTAKCNERIAATVVGCGWMPEPLDVEPLATPNKCPILFLVGSRDQQVPLEFVRVGHDAFERAGHPVELRVIKDFGHGWPRMENERVWKFLSRQRLPEAIASEQE